MFFVRSRTYFSFLDFPDKIENTYYNFVTRCFVYFFGKFNKDWFIL